MLGVEFLVQFPFSFFYFHDDTCPGKVETSWRDNGWEPRKTCHISAQAGVASPVTLRSPGCQEQGCHLSLRALHFSTPTWVGFWGRSAWAAEMKVICCQVHLSPPAIPFICLRESNLLLQETASGLFPFLVLSSCTHLRSHKFCDVITWAYRCCLIYWHMRKCTRICV